MRRIKNRAIRAMAVIGALMVLGCGPRGDLIQVQVCGDVMLPDEIDAIRVSVLDEARNELRAGTRELVLCPEDRLLTLPQTVEFGGVESADAWVVVQGLKEGIEVMRYARRASLSTSVVEQITLVVDRECLGINCVLGQTCVAGECEIVSEQAPEGACESAATIIPEEETEEPPAEPEEMPDEEPEEQEEPEGPMYCPAPPMMEEDSDA